MTFSAYTKALRTIAALSLSIGACLPGVAAQTATQAAGPPVPTVVPESAVASGQFKDEVRVPWSRNDENFVREWLVLGPLSSSVPADHSAPGALLVHDDLGQSGGEEAARPVADAVVKRANGAISKWRSYTSWTDATDFSDVFPGDMKDNVVAYVYRAIPRAVGGKAVLSIASDESLRVWLNGTLVHQANVSRRLAPDEDRIEVEMNAGNNSLLVKTEHRAGPWELAVRVLEPGSVLAPEAEIGPSIVASESRGESLVVQTDIHTPMVSTANAAQVKVEAVGAGGRVLGIKVAPRGAKVSFSTVGWPDGAYEIRCTTRTLAGDEWAAHIPWFKGDSLALAKRLIAAAERADVSTPEGLTLKMLSTMVLDRLGNLAEVAGNPWWKVHSALLEFEELTLEPSNPLARKRPYGFLRLAYRDDVDDSAQFCRAYLPRGYNPSTKWPLVVFLHGSSGTNPPYVRWEGADSRRPTFGDNTGAIILEPHGRGNTAYAGFGTRDVLSCIQLAKERLGIDEDRVYLTGQSMGGWGVFEIGTRHPELFAALAPVFGGSDYHVQMTEQALAHLSAQERFVEEENSSFAQAESLSSLPIFVHHGDADTTVDVNGSRYVVRMLQRWGYDVRYREHPGKGHEDLKIDKEVVDWLLEHKRNAQPSHVRIRAAELSSASAYWVTVERYEHPLSFMHVDAALVAPNVVRLDTENVLTVDLSPAAPLIDPAKPVQVLWNGGPAKTFSARAGRMVLDARRDAHVGLEKSPSTAGTLFDVFSTPFAVVVGTSSPDAAMRQRCRDKADEFVDFWQRWQHARPRVLLDTATSDADAANFSLLLVGGPDANVVAEKLRGQIPLQVSPNEIAVDGHPFSVSDAVVELIYPNPRNPLRYVFEVAGSSPEGLYFWFPEENVQYRSHGDRKWDFVLRDGRDGSGARRPFSDRMRIAAGVFDSMWRYDETAVVRGDPETRKALPLVRAPVAISTPHAACDACVGKYRVASGVDIEIAKEAGRLLIRAGDTPTRELVPEAADAFFLRGSNLRVVFERDSAGKVVSMTLRFPIEDIAAEKTD